VCLEATAGTARASCLRSRDRSARSAVGRDIIDVAWHIVSCQGSDRSRVTVLGLLLSDCSAGCQGAEGNAGSDCAVPKLWHQRS